MRAYSTIVINQLINIDFSQINETSKDTVRKSLDSSEFVAKWEGEMPHTISTIPEADRSALMNHTEVRALMATEAWTEEMIP